MVGSSTRPMSVSGGNVTYLFGQCGHFVDTALPHSFGVFRFSLNDLACYFLKYKPIGAGLLFTFLPEIRVTELFVNSLG